MKRPNYGLALSSDGSYQVVSTWYAPGIRDEWSESAKESFVFLVAPAEWVDRFLSIKQHKNYWEERRVLMLRFSLNYMNAIMQYFGFKNIQKSLGNFPDDEPTEEMF